MSSGQDVGVVRLNQTLVFREVIVTAADLTAEGVFVLNSEADPSTDGPLLTLDPGVALHGIQVMDGGQDSTTSEAGRLVTLRCASDAGALLVGESLGPNTPTTDTSPSHRFKIVGSTNAAVGVDSRPIQFLYDSAAERWWIPDWGSFTATTPEHWNGSAPTSSADAIDRLAAAFNAQHGPVP